MTQSAENDASTFCPVCGVPLDENGEDEAGYRHDDDADTAPIPPAVPQPAENDVPLRMDGMQSTKSLYSLAAGLDDPDWMRPWPFGPVHYSEDWPTRLDGRFDTVCGKSPFFWPETDWPESDVCPECRAWVQEHGTPVRMRYQDRVIPPVTSYPDMPCEDCEQGLSTCCVPPVVSKGGA